MPKSMTQNDLAVILAGMVRDCESYRDTELMPERIRAMEYYNGTMVDTPSEDNRSSVISRDVRAAIKKLKPSIYRTILGNDKVVEYLPTGEGDEETAEQAGDYINNVILAESDGKRAIKAAIHDALLLRNGILKWWFEEKKEVKVSRHKGLSDDEFTQIAAPDNVEVLEHSQRSEEIQVPETGEIIPVTVHDCKIKRIEEDGRNRVGCVPMEEFLIHPDATTIEDATIVGQHTRPSRSDLVAMGYNKAAIFKLSDAGIDEDQDSEKDARRDYVEDTSDHLPKELREVDYYELFVRIDFDNDGIAEMRRIVMIGGLKGENIFENDEWDEAPYADVVVEDRPHQWEGYSIFDDVQEIQRIKTVLHRHTLDNIYWQNNMQPTYQEGTVQNPEAITNPKFGEPIRLRQGVLPRDAVAYNTVPFIGDSSFAMLAYMDDTLTDRTGISDAASGMAPDALQNMTAKATALIEQAGIGQVEDMVRTIATGGIKRMFQGLLKLVIQYQDKPRTVRLRDEWITYDPKSWNADMDVSVNTGLGAGTRERDVIMMKNVMDVQEKILLSLGADNPFVKPDNLYNAIEKFLEATGLHSTALYVTKPDPQEVQAQLEAQRNQPNPEMMKLQADIELEKAKMQNAMQLEQAKMQASTQKETAQMQADLKVREADLQISAAADQMKFDFEREKLASQEQIQREQMAFDAQIEEIRIKSANAENQANSEAKSDISQLVEAVLQSASMPRRVVKDENGDVIGVETVLN